VQEHDIGGTNRRSEQLGVRRAATLVDRPLGVAQRTTVAVVSVKPVVEALGDAEDITYLGGWRSYIDSRR